MVGADCIGPNESNLPVAVNDMLPWIVGCCKIVVYFMVKLVKQCQK